MRLAIALGLLAGLAGLARADAPALEGSWRGRLGPEKGGLRLVLTITKDGSGARRATLDSIDQRSKIPVDRVTLDGDKLTLSIPLLGGGYEARLDASGTRMEGTWTQRGVPAQPLAFAREGASAPIQLKGSASAFGPTLEAQVPSAPVVLIGAQQRFLVYEIFLTNLGRGELQLVSLETRDATGAVLGKSDAAELRARVLPVGRASEGSDADLVIAPGTRTVLFAWLPCPAKAPVQLSHRIEVREPDGVARKIDAASTPVFERALAIGPPLRGEGWVAANGPDNDSPHRRALLPLPGRAYDAQRYAIDWVRIGADGKTSKGDPKLNASYLAYGQDVIAVADAKVVAVRDGLADNVPGPPPRPTRETLVGNYVQLDLGGGRRALYAHLQPGSLAVKVGDRVKRGQRLGLLGNSGNSTEPHLHFHVAEGEDPIAAEGLPYTITSYASRGTDPKAQLTPRAGAMPMQNEVVSFAP